jgi:hypothetical protein
MRPRHPHAAESGVGKHNARESESVQACAAGKERVTNAHPQKLASEVARLPGPFFFYGSCEASGAVLPFRRPRRPAGTLNV